MDADHADIGSGESRYPLGAIDLSRSLDLCLDIGIGLDVGLVEVMFEPLVEYLERGDVGPPVERSHRAWHRAKMRRVERKRVVDAGRACEIDIRRHRRRESVVVDGSDGSGCER